ncbi:MAG: hypothetical protein QM661_04625 [Solimonas sp.]
MDIVRNLCRSRARPQPLAPVDAAAAGAAEEWFAVNLDKEAHAGRRAEFEAWLREPENAAAYWRVHQVWNTIGRCTSDPRLDALTRRALADTEVHGPARQRISISWLVASSMVVIALLCGMWLGRQFWGGTLAAPTEEVAQATVMIGVGARSLLPSVSAVQWGTRDPSASEGR